MEILMSRGLSLTALLFILSCAQSNSTHGPPRDLSIGGNGGDDLSASIGDDASTGNDGASSGGSDLYGVDGPVSSIYGDLGTADTDGGGQCVPPNTGSVCANPIGGLAGCQPVEDCGPKGTGNGLDDNCNGVVDEGCSCTPGDVESCFLGPPGKHKIGACTDGTQTCEGAEFGSWGPCKGSIGPKPETCDKLDNDCNGCADDGLCCDAVLACPAPGDPRIAPQPPYTDVYLKGEQFFTGNAATWSWTIVGGPCDQLFAQTTGNPPKQSFTLTGANMRDATAHFTLSGDYTVTMTVVDTAGKTYTCTWVQHIVGPGVRFELCWDHQGSAAQGGADLDLHVHRSGTKTKWFGPQMSNNADDCNFYDCNPDAYQPCTPLPPLLYCPSTAMWGYTASAIAACSGAPATAGGNTWMSTTNNCPNPRLDVDNVQDIGRPENTNIDHPKDNDSFRAMVHYYGQDGLTSTNNVEEHPMVNIYCGGTLTATYGQAPNTLGPCPGAACFNKGTGWDAGQMWRVADVVAHVDAQGNTTGCTVTAIHPPATTSGYYVTTSGDAF
jgi:hypothetical protein